MIALLLAPEQEDITRELGCDAGTLGAMVAGVADRRRRPAQRGDLLPRLPVPRDAQRRCRSCVAALISSAIWGLFHYTGPGTWGVVLQITVFGLWLSWLYERTGSIWPTIAVHMVNNAIAFTILIST